MSIAGINTVNSLTWIGRYLTPSLFRFNQQRPISPTSLFRKITISRTTRTRAYENKTKAAS